MWITYLFESHSFLAILRTETAITIRQTGGISVNTKFAIIAMIATSIFISPLDILADNPYSIDD